jgi:OmpA-OmpF porin, OOP family
MSRKQTQPYEAHDMYQSARPFAGFFVSCILLSTLCWAEDMADSRDHPLLKRFAGSEIVGYDVKRFDAYELQTSTYRRYDLASKRREFAKPALHLEGARTTIWYEAPGNTGSTELIRNYQNELKAQRFEILYDSTNDSAAGTWVNFLAPFAESTVKTTRSSYVFYAADAGGVRVTSAKLSRPEGDVYVHLTAVQWSADDGIFKAKKGAYLAVEIVEIQPMEQNMVLVNAEGIARAIDSAGRIGLYALYFDTNKADLTPDSKPELAEIAKYLKANPTLKLRVVGHTDSVGGFEFNLDLSKRRAEAVVAALAKDFGIAADRLAAHGVAYLSPVASNATEEGRAKDRRVELVPW